MLVPILDAPLNPRHNIFEGLDLISSRRSVTNGAVCKQVGEDGILNLLQPEKRALREVKFGFQLEILAAEPVDLIGPWLRHASRSSRGL